MRKISITEALNELKLYDSKIMKAITNAKLVGAAKKSADKVGVVKKDDFEERAKNEGGKKIVIGIERNKGYLSTYEMTVFNDGTGHDEENFDIVERVVKSRIGVDKKRGGNSREIELNCKVTLKKVLNLFDCLFGFSDGKMRRISVGNSYCHKNVLFSIILFKL